MKLVLFCQSLMKFYIVFQMEINEDYRFVVHDLFGICMYALNRVSVLDTYYMCLLPQDRVLLSSVKSLINELSLSTDVVPF